MLTRKQRQLLSFIDQKLKTDGISPSFEEMKEALGLKSKSGVHRLITALVERSFIRRLPNRARALEVLRLPEDSPNRRTAEEFSHAEPSLGSNVVRIIPHRVIPVPEQTPQVIEIPMHGKIAAGLPIEALERHDSHLAVPQSMLSRGEHFALEIQGDSMMDAGIVDGDIVIVCKCETARDGEIVVALVDQTEATLKEFRRQDNMISLVPKNSHHIPQILDPSRVQIQGRLVGLMRKY